MEECCPKTEILYKICTFISPCFYVYSCTRYFPFTAVEIVSCIFVIWTMWVFLIFSLCVWLCIIIDMCAVSVLILEKIWCLCWFRNKSGLSTNMSANILFLYWKKRDKLWHHHWDWCWGYWSNDIYSRTRFARKFAYAHFYP